MHKINIGRILLFLLFSSIFINPLYAGDKKYTVSQKTYKVLEKSRALMDKVQYGLALTTLNKMLLKVPGNRYETALLHQHLAYVYLEQQNYPLALTALEKTLSYADTLPAATVQSLRYNLAQSATQSERYLKAENSLNKWFLEEKSPTADAWYLRGIIQYKQQKFVSAAGYIQNANAQRYHENWSVLLLSLYIELKKYPQATSVLQTLVSKYPNKKRYWLNLTDVYLIRQDYQHALSSLQLAHLSTHLNEQEILKLASLYLHSNTPYSAAKLLQNSINEKRITRNVSNLTLLADSWAMSRKPKKELHALLQAAKLEKKGTLYLRCAQIYLRLEQWDSALRLLDKALNKNTTQSGQVYFLKGIAAYQAEKMHIASKAFQQAGRYKKTKQQAKQWLDQINEKPLNDIAQLN